MPYLSYAQFIAKYPDWFSWTSYEEYLYEYYEYQRELHPHIYGYRGY